MSKYMIFPGQENSDIKLVRCPDDFDRREIYRRVTGLIAELEQDGAKPGWDEIAQLLEDHGFTVLDYVLGPEM